MTVAHLVHLAAQASLVAMVFGMALTLEGINRVKERTRWDVRKPGAAETLRALWKHMQALGNPDLQFIAYSGLNAADKVIADVACLVYAIYIEKPSTSVTDAWLKGSDHATVAAANGDFVAKLLGTAAAAAKRYAVIFSDGLNMGTGFTLGSHTTVNGNTKSNVADAPTGFVVVG
jgi:hypothetical protein